MASKWMMTMDDSGYDDGDVWVLTLSDCISPDV